MNVYFNSKGSFYSWIGPFQHRLAAPVSSPRTANIENGSVPSVQELRNKSWTQQTLIYECLAIYMEAERNKNIAF